MTGNLKSYLAEMIGTFAWVFVAAGSVCMDQMTGGKLGLVGVALAPGLAVAAMVYIYGPVSGGHFNPAVTIAMLVSQRTDSLKCVFYVISQLFGAAIAGLFLNSVLRAHPDLISAPPFLGGCDLAGVGFKAATLLEAVMTFFLVSTIYATAVDSRGSKATAPLAIGMTVTFCILAGGPLTGAALNPARTFGPAVVSGHWANWYVYWAGPLVGGAAAALLYENLYLEK